MRFYTVHLRGAALDPDRDLVLVEEGFCWPAFFFSVIWALWHRMWLAALLLFALKAGANEGAHALGLSAGAHAAVMLGAIAAIGFVANDLRRHWLGRRGFRDAGVVAAEGHDAALRRFLDANRALGFGMGA